MSNTPIFIGSIFRYLLHQAQLHVSAIFRLYMNTYQVVTQTICGLFLGVGGVVQVRYLVFVKEGCVVWVTIGNCAII